MRSKFGTKRKIVVALTAAAVSMGGLTSLAPPAGAAEVVARVSVVTGGGEATGGVASPVSDISADGRWVAFSSDARNLVTGDTNGVTDIFVHDRQTVTTTRVSVATGGNQGDLQSLFPSISDDGRVVAFHSDATNLVADDTNAVTDVFAHDRQTGTTTRVSVASDGSQTTGGFASLNAAVSGDGRWVAFEGRAVNLVPEKVGTNADTFVHDRQTSTTTRVSVGPGGVQGNSTNTAALAFPAISTDGRYVAFSSRHNNLVPDDTNGALNDIFVHDRQAGTTVRASVSSTGAQSTNGSAGRLDLSGDGRFVAFSSFSDGMVPGDNNLTSDTFLRDLQAGTTVRISVLPNGAEAPTGGTIPSISRDGRFVSFESTSPLVAGDTNGNSDIFVYDRETGANTRVSEGPAGLQSNSGGISSAISADGRFISFTSAASNLIPGDTNEAPDVFVSDRTAAPVVAGARGYRLVASDGGIFSFGDAGFFGSTGALRLNRPVVGGAATPTGRGYWLVASDGGIFAFGDAGFFGSTGALRLAQPIVGMAATPTGRGYWLVASDGGIFAFGDATFLGSTGALRLARPIVGMAASATGRGYRLVASDGGIFAFGDATFHGSTGALRLAQPIVGMAATGSGRGYWLVASDGGVFAFGDATFLGSTGALRLARPIVGIGATGTGRGYRLVASDGGVFAFGDAPFLGSTGALRLNQPIIGMTS